MCVEGMGKTKQNKYVGKQLNKGVVVIVDHCLFGEKLLG